MEMNLEIISYQRHSMSDEQSQFCFKTAGGTIGRSQDNDWTIDDPDRLISGHHCAVHFENNRFIILDTSTNGLFVSDDSTSLGDRTHVVSNGDIFTMGEYRLQAILIATQNNAVFSGSSGQYDNAVGHDQNSQPVHIGIESNEQSIPLFPPAMSTGNIVPDKLIRELDPLNNIDAVAAPGRLNNQDILAKTDPVNSVLNSVPSTQSYFDLPAAIPEDWHSSEQSHNAEQNTADVGDFEDFQNDFNLKPVSNRHQVAEPVNAHENIESTHCENSTVNRLEQPVEVPAIKEDEPVINKVEFDQTNEQTEMPALSLNSSSNKDHLNIIFDIIGINTADVSDEKIPQLLKNIALIAKGSMSGLMQTMLSRAHLKNEFRMSMTTIQTQENNPLKFCINYEQLVNYMLVNPTSGYLDANDAISQSFNELQEHQIGVMAGMKSAMMHMLDRMSPEKVSDKVERIKSSNFSLVSKKSRYWDAYSDIYKDILEEDDVFNTFFSNQFSKAYEHQIETIRQHKNNKKQ